MKSFRGGFGVSAYRVALGLGVSLLAMPAFVSEARAQEAAAAAANEAQAASDEGTQSEEIVVTATRKAEALSKVPVSLSAFSQEQLDQQGVSTVDDLVQNTPGVTLRRDGNGTSNLAVRGISSIIGAATTGVYIDDTPIQIRQAGLSFTATNAFPNILDLERVEVLRGPQGTLFGSGSMGGAVRFITPQPSLDGLDVYARGDISSTRYGEPSHETVVAVGAPIIEDKLGFRISGSYTRMGGYIDRIPQPELIALYNAELAGRDLRTGGGDKNANWSDGYTFRASLTLAPSETFKLTPAVFFQRTYENSDGDYWEFFSDPKEGVFRNGDQVETPKKDRWWLPSLTAEIELPIGTLISNTSYFNRVNRNTYDITFALVQLTSGGEQSLTPLAPFVPGFPELASQASDPNKQQVFTQEVRLQSDSDSRFSWILGAFYQRARATAQDFVYGDATLLSQLTLGLFGLPNYLDIFGVAPIDGEIAYLTYDELIDKQYAAFGELSFDLLDNLTLTAGLRYSKNKLNATSLQGGPYAGTPTLVGFSAKQSESPLTPKFNVAWQATEDSLVYATAAKGFRGGGVNQPLPPICNAGLTDAGFSTTPDSYGSDSLWSYEIGSKNRLMDRRLSLDVSAFHIDWTDIQNSVYIGLGCNRSVVFNAATAKSQGFDLATTFRPVDELTLSAAVGYTKAEYTENLLGSPNAAGVRPTIIAKGDSIPDISPWSISASLQYDVQVAARDAYLRAEYQYAGAHKDSTINNPITTSFNGNAIPDEAYSKVNVRAGLNFGEVELVAYVDNLFDVAPEFRSQNGDSGNMIFRSFTLRPRTVGLQLTYRH